MYQNEVCQGCEKKLFLQSKFAISPLSKKRDYPSVKEKGKLSFLIVEYKIKLRIWQHLK